MYDARYIPYIDGYYTQVSTFCQDFLSVYLYNFIIFLLSNLLGCKRFFEVLKHKLVIIVGIL